MAITMQYYSEIKPPIECDDQRFHLITVPSEWGGAFQLIYRQPRNQPKSDRPKSNSANPFR